MITNNLKKSLSAVILLALLFTTLGCQQLVGEETLCPEATPELFRVEPVTSPTNELSQIITVELGNAEMITISAESGSVSVGGDGLPTEIEFPLLADTTHNLTVEGKVREVTSGDCTYGGYTLTTTTDRNGDPLVIEQES